MCTRRLNELSTAIQDTAADGIIGIDSGGNILFSSPASERMLLCESTQLCGRHLSDFLHQEDPRSNWTTHPLAGSHGGSVIVRRDCDLFQRASDTSFRASYTASAIEFEGDGSFGWVLAFQDITERKQAEEELFKTGRYDGLTGLHNRLMFQDYFAKPLKRVSRSKQHLALLFLDLDNFKIINDTFGHLAGDQLLQLVV